MLEQKGRLKYYIFLFTVVVLWVFPPIAYKWILSYYSPALRLAVASLISLIAFLIVGWKKLKLFHRGYLKTALPTGLFFSAACVLQQVGLDKSTPAMYAFLENLSCLVVPLLVWAMTKKRPSVWKLLAAVLCLVSVYFLSGGKQIFQSGIGIGELMCGAAGIFYGVNLAVTGVKAKNLDSVLYLIVQFAVQVVVSFAYAFAFEEIRFSFQPLPLTALVGFALLFTVAGWLLRTLSLKGLDASFVSVVMPFSSVLTVVLSVVIGTDVLSINLVLGALFGIVAVLLSEFEPKKFFKKRRAKRNQSPADEMKDFSQERQE